MRPAHFGNESLSFWVELVEPKCDVYVVIAEKGRHLRKTFAVLLENVNILAYYLAPFAQLLCRLLPVHKRRLSVALWSKISETVYSQKTLLYAFFPTVSSHADDLPNDLIEAASNRVALFSFPLFDFSFEGDSLANVHQLVSQLQLQWELLVEQLHTALKDSCEEGLGVAHTDLSDSICNYLPFGQ